MNWQLVVWIYVALLLVGGLIGFLKARSKVSLIAAVAAAIALALTAAGVLPFAIVPMVLSLLMVQFNGRLFKTKRFMPSGMLLVLTLSTLAAVLVLNRR